MKATLMLILCFAAAPLASSACHDDPAGKPVQASYRKTSASYATPDVTLVDQDGRRVALKEALAQGTPLALNFIFTSCTTVCPVMSATFAGLRKRLGAEADRVGMVSISIDPERDTPAALQRYAARYHAPPAWRFYTGTREDIDSVLRAFGAFTGDKVNHQPATFFRSAQGEWVRLDGLPSAAQLSTELHHLLASR